MPTGTPRARRAADVCLVVLFLLALWTPLARNCLGPAASTSTSEARTLAAFPDFRLKRAVLLKFPALFEAYYGDHFGFRASLIHWLSEVKVRWLALSTSPRVLIGRQGWFFYQPEQGDRTPPFTPEELAQWQEKLEARRDWLAQRGIRYLFFVAPDKQTIYPEFLPAGRRPASGPTRLDQLLGHLRQHSDLPVVDLRGPLLKAKEQERVYCRTDSHWNDLGAYVGYREVLGALAAWFPGMEPCPRAHFTGETIRGPAGDLTRMLDQPGWLEDWLILRPRERLSRPTDPATVWLPEYRPDPQRLELAHPDATRPTALMFRDSFGYHFIPFLAEHFRRSVYLVGYPFDTAAVLRERPDVVVQEVVERFLLGPPGPPEELPAE